MIFDILHRDGLILVMNKPEGLPVHKGPKAAGFDGPVLTDFLNDYTYGLPNAPALAHRLDRDTSGCLILGRHRKSLELLGILFKEQKIKKTYLALVEGHVKENTGKITAKLMKRDATRGWWMKVDNAGEDAVTLYKVLERRENSTLMELSPLTGRTHQLRVHMLHLGHPIIGDKVYGSEPRFSENRLMLHAWKIAIPHNLKKNADTMLKVEAPVPLAFAMV
jgi:tRNA pseudouridine32 synthase / 23S rRNA pseudouridine746 synthase